MAIRVICPSGCRLQIPNSRAGALLRCPKCSQIIRVEELTEVAEQDGMQTLSARLSTEAELQSMKQQVEVRQPPVRRRRKKSVTEISTKTSEDRDLAKSAARPAVRSKPAKRPASPESTTSNSRGKKRWRMPGDPSKYEAWERERLQEKHELQLLEKGDVSAAATNSPQVESVVTGESPREAGGSKHVDEPDANAARTVGVRHSFQTRSRAILLALVLIFIGIFLLIPAIPMFIEYVASGSQTPIPRWAAWLVFAGLLQFFYVVYLWQLADWTAVWAVAIMMLLLTFCAAILLAGLAVGQSGGVLPQAFQIPHSLINRAEIWLLMLLTITSLVGYLAGREAFRWKRSEDRWRDAEGDSASAAS